MNRHFLFLALFSLVAFLSFGQGYQVQSKYFVYLQTEPAQPFYIKINNQKIDANASGYLILPQLKDGDYRLIIGFPQNKVEEQAFNFRIDSKDKGYLIKDYGADGWGLFDLQTMAVQKATKASAIEVAAVKQVPPPPPTPKVEPKKEEAIVAADGVSDFTKVLSQAAKDPSLLEKPKPVQVEEKPAIIEEEVVVANNTNAKETQSAQFESENKVQENKPASGEIKLIYDDRNDLGQVDPITIYISAPKTAVQQQPAKKVVQESVPQNLITEPKVDVKAEEKSLTKVSEPPVVSTERAVIKTTNASCKSVAEEDDFLKLRRTMASQANDDSMIEQAKKAFATKCYTTAQVKYLSSMFLSNAGKYNFYVVAQPHIADKDNFASLASEIKDSGYRDKFNTLLQ